MSDIGEPFSCEVCLGDFRFALTPLRYEREPYGDYWDDNWIKFRSEAIGRTGSFSQVSTIHAGDILYFRSDLEVFIAGDCDRVKLNAMEPEVDLSLTRGEHGVDFVGETAERGRFSEYASTVRIRLDDDAVADFYAQWRSLYEAFPIRTPPWVGTKWSIYVGPDKSYVVGDEPAGKFVFTPDDVPPALNQLQEAGSASDGEQAYRNLLNTIGHDHSGVMYPAAAGVVSSLVFIATTSGPVAAARALDVLIDLAGSFQPLPEFSTVTYFDGRVVDVKEEVGRSIVASRNRIAALTHSPDPHVANLARDLLSDLPEVEGNTAD